MTMMMMTKMMTPMMLVTVMTTMQTFEGVGPGRTAANDVVDTDSGTAAGDAAAMDTTT